MENNTEPTISELFAEVKQLKEQLSKCESDLDDRIKNLIEQAFEKQYQEAIKATVS